jgi:hypothetical protein
MSLFRHPHLVRGVVHTQQGQFFICRGLVEMPDEVGERLGWQRVDADEDTPAPRPQMGSTAAGRRQEPSVGG